MGIVVVKSKECLADITDSNVTGDHAIIKAPTSLFKASFRKQ